LPYPTGGARVNLATWVTSPISGGLRIRGVVRISAVVSAEILLVDDDDDVRESMADILEHAGYRVSHANSAETALARLRDGLRPELMIVDYQLDGMTGTQFLSKCRATPGLNDIPAVLLSGYGREKLPESMVGLMKPVDPAQLFEVLSRLHVSPA
jgi:CheY-like chemotaxis protein